MMMKSFLCVLVLFGAVTLSLASCPRDCCCMNGGTKVTDRNNCCTCQCPAEFSGDYCEKRAWRKVIAKWVYGGGSNQYWHLLQSSNVTDQPDRKGLERKRGYLDHFDNFVTFQNGDPNPVLTLQFRGTGKKELHYLKGQFWTARPNQHVIVTAYNGAGAVHTQQINLVVAKTYQNWRIDFNKFVTRVEFAFSGPCDCEKCFGLNYMFGEYTLWIDDSLTCPGVTCPGNKSPVFKYGCCECAVVCNNEIDLILILDKSGSMGGQIPALQEISKDIIRRFNVEAQVNATHIAAILYDSSAYVRFGLKMFSTFAQYETNIDSFPGAGGGTDIREALQLAKTHLTGNGRANVPKASMLLTDGKSGTNFISAAAQLRTVSTLVTIGVGSNVDEADLRAVATNNQYIHSSNVAQLEMVLDNLIAALCSSSTV